MSTGRARCSRLYRGHGEWNVDLRKVGLVCPTCQTGAENAEAVTNEATIVYGQDMFGRAVGRPKA